MKAVQAAKAADSESAKMAQAALANLKTIDKVRSQGGDIDQAYARLCRSERQAGGKGPGARDVQARGRPSAKIVAAVAGAAICALAVVGVVAIGGFSRSHSVAGTVRLEKWAIPNARVVFHALSSGAAVGETTTTETGGFKLDDLTPGTYRVTVNGGEGTRIPVPAAYGRPESTPFQLIVRKDLDNVAMTAVRE